jgi:uncharacterized protein DUF397
VARRSSAYVVEVEPSGIRWVKSSASSGGDSNCVEAVLGADLVLLRDSKDRPGPRLTFPAAGWTAFLGNLRADADVR